jgi:hypothetical protein
MSAALPKHRMKALRERRAAGFMIVQIKIPEALVDDLIEAKLLSPMDADNRITIAAALERLLRTIRVSSSEEKVG